jgi:hypothetical protein
LVIHELLLLGVVGGEAIYGLLNTAKDCARLREGGSNPVLLLLLLERFDWKVVFGFSLADVKMFDIDEYVGIAGFCPGIRLFGDFTLALTLFLGDVRVLVAFSKKDFF